MNTYRLGGTRILHMNMWNQLPIDGSELNGHYEVCFNQDTYRFTIRKFGGYGNLVWFPKVNGELLGSLNEVDTQSVLRHISRRLDFTTTSWDFPRIFDKEIESEFEVESVGLLSDDKAPPRLRMVPTEIMESVGPDLKERLEERQRRANE